MTAVLPWHDCPECPSCQSAVGIPARNSGAIGRWYGPDDATLFCPACGTGWVGNAADVEQAELAQVAWEERFADETDGTK